ncbi:hypothetical protein LWI28_018121 [Acer negundo]|uniref:DUF506 family protein n=1 Tax=Acer negundo TaxID=4023 RepID=A0AAD5IES1_ACENE|nr:hypothetical protein LWI28_018121 [Acer negundo]KAK4837525.1 hypothetical protein QYF36_006194 [Acer negundo]
MARIPVKFKRVAAAFNEVAARGLRLCESSGSEHSASLADLSDLVNSFMEKDQYHGGVVDHDHDEVGEELEEILQGKESGYWCDSERTKILKGLLECGDDGERLRIHGEIEIACRLAGDKSSHGFKRRLMTLLRDRGFDAGLCKSRWEKTRRFPAGSYEYVDVNVGAIRYIIEVNLAGEFEIARPTDGYTSLLGVFSPIFVGKPEELKKIVRQMCAAVKESMKSVEMHMPPWRRNGYMQSKWFATYKRTINPLPATKTPKFDEGSFTKKRSIGFVASQVRPYRCGDDFSSRVGLKIGQLSAAFSSGEDVGV